MQTCTAYLDAPDIEYEACAPPETERLSVQDDGQREAHEFKWIVSQKAGCDQGESAINQWVSEHWNGYLRARWLEHLQGRRFWVELDKGDFGLLQHQFHDDSLLLDRILDRLKAGQENLNVMDWAILWHMPCDRVRRILKALDINRARLECRFRCG